MSYIDHVSIFVIFVGRFLLQVFNIYYIPETVIMTCSAKKMSLKLPIISKFETLTKYLKNTSKRLQALSFLKNQNHFMELSENFAELLRRRIL